ncbi:GNAT family N-acetyltransferase [Nocardioides litoris]|uniref:GNAT family N-acetyltransferase n=1 Tax=Nocardioides litoris TaxID=1926648 RepID=UPI00111DF0BE|nr:GNAT family N-acetyltransferase [Nocardioides litoris]
MLWRVRATLPDRPGALAALARECGGAGVNIAGFQAFPDHAEVTDELVLSTPEGWTAGDLVDLVARADGTGVVAAPCTPAALADQPTRYVEACRAVLAQPATFPDVVAHLFDAETQPGTEAEDVLEMTVGDVLVQVRRVAPFTEVERARGAAIAALVGDVLDRDRPAFAPSASRRMGSGAMPAYVVDGAAVTALAEGVAVGRAVVVPTGEPGVHAVELEVDAAHQRRGIGTRLLGDAARLARTLGATEVLLTTEHDNRAVLPMVLAAGMRGRIRMAGETLTVRIAVTDLRVREADSA